MISFLGCSSDDKHNCWEDNRVNRFLCKEADGGVDTAYSRLVCPTLQDAVKVNCPYVNVRDENGNIVFVMCCAH